MIETARLRLEPYPRVARVRAHTLPRVSASRAILALVLVLPLRTSAQQPIDTPERLLEALVGRWEYVMRGSDGTEYGRGSRTYTRRSADALLWEDATAGGRTARGELRVVDGEIEYAFPGEKGTCFVRGAFSVGGQVSFRRDGPCYGEVYESLLVVRGADRFSDLSAVGRWTFDFTRVE